MFSLVVPTRNRPAYLERLLRYYAGQRSTAPMWIADSSDPAALEANRRVITSARAAGLVISHEVHPVEIAMYDKIHRGLARVETPFVALVGDDDFIVPAGARAAAAHLAAHPEVAICHGRAAVFTLGMVDARGASIPLHVQTYRQRAVRGRTPASRLARHLGRYATTMYSMHRTADLVANMAACRDHVEDFQFGELLPSCLSVVQGEVAKLDVLYMVREHLVFSEGRKTGGWGTMRARPYFDARYGRFRRRLADELVTRAGHTPRAAAAIVDALFLRVYLGYELYGRAAQRMARNALDAVRLAPTVVAEAGLGAALRAPRDAYWSIAARHPRPSTDPLRLERLLDPANADAAAFRPIYDLVMENPTISRDPMRVRAV